MSLNRLFEDGSTLFADYLNALGEFLGSAVLNWSLQIKSTDATVLQVPAGRITTRRASRSTAGGGTTRRRCSASRRAARRRRSTCM